MAGQRRLRGGTAVLAVLQRLPQTGGCAQLQLLGRHQPAHRPERDHPAPGGIRPQRDGGGTGHPVDRGGLHGTEVCHPSAGGGLHGRRDGGAGAQDPPQPGVGPERHRPPAGVRPPELQAGLLLWGVGGVLGHLPPGGVLPEAEGRHHLHPRRPEGRVGYPSGV